MMKAEVGLYKGKLIIKNDNAILETSEKTYFPVPFSKQTEISKERMKRISVEDFKDYIGRSVTIAGFLQNDIIFDAQVVRTYMLRDPNEAHGEEYWNDRIPKANILWKARRLPLYPEQFSVDVRQMITINDSVIERDLIEHNLLVSNPEKCNEDIYLIYRHSRVKKINPYNYAYDKDAFGCEFFMYPYELRELHKGDCDDWGLELASYLITAGVPDWRIRCVVGWTFSGEGHLTVYVLADDLSTWYHLNSTTPWWLVEEKGYNKLTDFPQSGDSDDLPGIADVWFSFNNKYAWHAFETHVSEDRAKKVPWFRNFKITPMMY